MEWVRRKRRGGGAGEGANGLWGIRSDSESVTDAGVDTDTD